MSGRKREWMGHVEAWRESGLSRKDYCSENGINIGTFHSWCRRYRQHGESVEAGLVEVRLRASARMQSSAPIELSVGRYTLRLDEGADLDLLQRVLDVVERR